MKQTYNVCKRSYVLEEEGAFLSRDIEAKFRYSELFAGEGCTATKQPAWTIEQARLYPTTGLSGG